MTRTTQSQVKKRPLVILATASSGFGHLQAAQNLLLGIRVSDPNLTVRIINIYDFMGPNQRRFVERGWERVSLMPGLRELYGIVHRLFSNSSFLSRWLHERFSEVAQRLSPHIDLENLGHFVALHPVAVPVGARLKKETGCQFSVVATDFVLHNIHCHAMVDRYLVAPQCKYVGTLPRLAYQHGRVWQVGIPIAVEFRAMQNCYTEVMQTCVPFQILVSFGACGYRGLQNLPLLRELIRRTDSQVRFVILTGHNTKFLSAAKAALEGCSAEGRVEIHGFEYDMAGLMAKSHLLIGKAGGLTVSEAFSVGLPMIVIDILPGQEEYNSRVIKDTGAGICTRNMSRIVRFIEELRQPERRLALRKLTLELGRASNSDRGASFVLTEIPTRVERCRATVDVSLPHTVVSSVG